MTDIESWSGTASANTASPPNGFPENMDFSDVNNGARETMAAVKRWQDRLHGTKLTAGTSAAYTLTHDTAPASYTTGQRYSMRAHTPNAAGATLNINGLGAVALYKQGSTQLGVLSAADIQSGAAFEVQYDGSRFQVMTPGPLPVQAGAVTGSNLTMTSGRFLGRSTAGTGAIEEFTYTTATSWTPVIAGSSVAGTQTYTNQIGRYYQIGNIIFFWFRVTLSAKDGTTAGSFRITGLPTAASNISSLDFAVTIGYAANVDRTTDKTIAATIGPNTSFIAMNEVGDNAAFSALAASSIQATTDVVGSGFYLV